MEQEIAAWKRSQERNKLIYNFKYVSRKNEFPMFSAGRKK
jgi:hypothetical protein